MFKWGSKFRGLVNKFVSFFIVSVGSRQIRSFSQPRYPLPSSSENGNYDVGKPSRKYAEMYVTQQFLEANGSQDIFFEKTKKMFLDMVEGSVYTKFWVCIVFRLVRERDTYKQTDIYTSKYRNIPQRFARLTLIWYLVIFVQPKWGIFDADGVIGVSWSIIRLSLM